MTEVIVTRRAARDLESLDRDVRKRVVAKIEECADDPRSHARKLTDSRIGDYRLRVGPWRVVFDLDHERMVILRVGHRREIYR